MKHSILALALMAAACGGEAPGDPQTSAQQADAPGGGSGGQSASASQPGAAPTGEAGQLGDAATDPNMDKLMGPCGPAHCPTDVYGWSINPDAYGCFEGICTFQCGPQTWDAAADLCKSLGGQCQGSATLLTCQR